ncbi:MAG TPA: stage III sporulation protein AB [Lachnospiraceae bacterium]|nr:stage III sporulation protein AB [Lachnospiraceae bacterium]
MLHLIGAVLTILGTTGFGLSLKKEMKQRIYHLKYIKKLFFYLQNEVEYHKSTLQEACENISKRAEEPYLKLYGKINLDMIENRGYPFGEVWKRNLIIMRDKIPITNKDMDLLMQFMEESFQDGKMQCKEIGFYIDKMQELIDLLENEYRNKSKIYVSLGVMSGILCTIIFI